MEGAFSACLALQDSACVHGENTSVSGTVRNLRSTWGGQPGPSPRRPVRVDAAFCVCTSHRPACVRRRPRLDVHCVYKVTPGIERFAACVHIASD